MQIGRMAFFCLGKILIRSPGKVFGLESWTPGNFHLISALQMDRWRLRSGMVRDWADLEVLWEHTFTDKLGVAHAW